MQRGNSRLLTSIRCLCSSRQSAGRRIDPSIVDEDRIRLSLRAGTGGAGIARYNGVGGDGGNVYMVGRRNMNFRFVRKQFRDETSVAAANGNPALLTKLIAAKGKDAVIYVPVGVEAVNCETKMLMARCRQLSQRYLLARGGQGGCSENKYSGLRGEHVLVEFHLKLRPNIGLVGLPNAGKSTLMKALVPDKKSIKIASYPFTTTRPQLCYVKHFENVQGAGSNDDFSLSIADLPGIVEGASANRGKGAMFLKHLEYSDILLLVVDIKGFQLKASTTEPFRSALESVAILNYEMERFNANLISKPTVLAINKVDLPNGEEMAAELLSTLKGLPSWTESVSHEFRPRRALSFDAIVPIAAKDGRIGNLKGVLLNLYRFLHPLSDPLNDLHSEDAPLRLA